MSLPQALWDTLADQQERRAARLVGLQWICEVPPGTRLGSCEHGIIVASPGLPPWLLKRDGSREEISSLPVDMMTP